MTSMGDLLHQLQDEGFIDGEQTIDVALLQDEGDDSPWFIQGLLGCGGWLAAVFLFAAMLFFLSLIFGEIISGIGLFVSSFGVILMGVTMMLRAKTDHLFVSQAALAIHIAGQATFVMGTGLMMHIEWDALVSVLAVVVILLESVLIFFYRDALFRFFATGAAIVAADVLVYQLLIPGGLSILSGILALAVVLIWSGGLPVDIQIRYRPLLLPLGYALIVGLFGTVIYELMNGADVFSRIAEAQLNQPIFTSVLLLILLIGVEARVLRDYQIASTERAALFIFGITIVIALPTLTTPGILAGLLVIVLGFWRRNALLLGLAYAFLAGFIIYYYNTLQTTLLVKSLILMATGILFLSGRFLLRRKLPVPLKAKEAL